MSETRCPHCQGEMIANTRFCSSCGFHVEVVAPQAEDAKPFTGLAAVMTIYFLMLVVCGYLKFGHHVASFDLLETSVLAISGIILVFAFNNRKELFPILFNKNIRWWLLPIIALGAVAANIGISQLVEFINPLNSKLFRPYMYEDTTHPLMWSILNIAIQPALFEELTFRGLMHNHLQRSMGITEAMVITSLLFAILHLSPISFLWLFPFGFLAAWMRKRSGHLWYGIVFHFCFNLTFILMAAAERGWLK